MGRVFATFRRSRHSTADGERTTTLLRTTELMEYLRDYPMDRRDRGLHRN